MIRIFKVHYCFMCNVYCLKNEIYTLITIREVELAKGRFNQKMLIEENESTNDTTNEKSTG